MPTVSSAELEEYLGTFASEFVNAALKHGEPTWLSEAELGDRIRGDIRFRPGQLTGYISPSFGVGFEYTAVGGENQEINVDVKEEDAVLDELVLDAPPEFTRIEPALIVKGRGECVNCQIGGPLELPPGGSVIVRKSRFFIAEWIGEKEWQAVWTRDVLYSEFHRNAEAAYWSRKRAEARARAHLDRALSAAGPHRPGVLAKHLEIVGHLTLPDTATLNDVVIVGVPLGSD